MKKNFAYILLLILTLASCTSYKQVPYFQNADQISQVAQHLPLYDAKIMPKDLLAITVNTTDPQVSAPFNLAMQTPINIANKNAYTTTQPTIQQYLVSNTGEIDFPILGRLKVGGLTKGEAEDMIREKLTTYLKEVPIVNVRMSNYKISVLGEVARPGTFTVSNTVYGIRDNVQLIREDSIGRKEIVELNLNDANLILSPYYYLRQNDILYVTPNKTKAKNSEIGSSTSLWISVTSTMVSIVSLLFNILR